MEKKFNLPKLCEGLIHLEQPAATHKSLQFNTSYDHHLLKILNRLHRLLMNTLSNAIKFTHQGGISFDVLRLKSTPQKVFVHFIIADTGIGIPQDQQARIFERFTRLSSSNQGHYRGIGLGLQIVKQFIDDLGGEIDLSSELDQGTQFIFTLPFKCPLTDDYCQ